MLELVLALMAMIAAAWRGCGRLLRAVVDHLVSDGSPAWTRQAWEGWGFPGGGPPGRRLARTALARAALARPAPEAQHRRLDGWSGRHYSRR
jgi:hypothetical protein